MPITKSDEEGKEGWMDVRNICRGPVVDGVRSTELNPQLDLHCERSVQHGKTMNSGTDRSQRN
ncbi:hypothetical protein K443DRAFT_678744 [Laccaria amethystina LaAM-08-1]|jgi:hypothetical protein|uniref:Uncharacterized protein n=1 Tax=Laccaria amethystina LaAM-08-1 TaxID=1095629 RepID=A0A0C9WRB9_9AGAR|nr:hypothetical protein K443DRAFT_678744 [Laccaria amethystina LaAM-08-1]